VPQTYTLHKATRLDRPQFRTRRSTLAHALVAVLSSLLVRRHVPVVVERGLRYERKIMPEDPPCSSTFRASGRPGTPKSAGPCCVYCNRPSSCAAPDPQHLRLQRPRDDVRLSRNDSNQSSAGSPQHAQLSPDQSFNLQLVRQQQLRLPIPRPRCVRRAAAKLVRSAIRSTLMLAASSPAARSSPPAHGASTRVTHLQPPGSGPRTQPANAGSSRVAYGRRNTTSTRVDQHHRRARRTLDLGAKLVRTDAAESQRPHLAGERAGDSNGNKPPVSTRSARPPEEAFL
jgi:hypothetical protein